MADPEHPENIVTGLVSGNQHSSKSIAIDNDGNLYVTIGAPSNACQVQDRTPASPGQDPCPILEKAGGLWQFKADKLNQSYAQGTRYATGIRNIVGIDWNTKEKQLYAVQHGRDQLAQLFSDLYSNEESAELPAEEFFLVKKGSDFGWPYCYYDQLQKKIFWVLNMVAMEKNRDVVQIRISPSWDFPVIGRRMICCFIQEKCSRINIKTALSLLFTEAGTCRH